MNLGNTYSSIQFFNNGICIFNSLCCNKCKSATSSRVLIKHHLWPKGREESHLFYFFSMLFILQSTQKKKTFYILKESRQINPHSLAQQYISPNLDFTIVNSSHWYLHKHLKYFSQYFLVKAYWVTSKSSAIWSMVLLNHAQAWKE